MMPSSSSSAPASHASITSLSSSSASSTSSPCAACKFLRRKCQPECVFAPYFPPDNPQKFVQVHRVFGASNVTKILNDLPTHQREDAVNSLAYEADMRLRDPVYGCVGVISILQQQLRQLQMDLHRAKIELSHYQNHPHHHPHAPMVSAAGHGGAVNVNISSMGPFGFAREGQLLMGIGRDGTTTNYPYHQQQQQQQQQQQHMMVRNCEGDMGVTARMGVNGTGFDGTGIVATAGGPTASLGMLGFLKPNVNGNGEERPSIGPA